MKLRPTQIAGVIAIVVFGGGALYRMLMPSEREIMERRLASLPRLEFPEPSFPIPDLPDTASLPPTSAAVAAAAVNALSIPGEPDYTTLGSQDARDDLYCSAVLGQEFDAKIKTDHPDKVTPLLDGSRKLEVAGVRKLDAQGITNADNWASFTLSFVEKARADYKAGALRIPVIACVERASKLPDIPR
jgi:hypothetical protein